LLGLHLGAAAYAAYSVSLLFASLSLDTTTSLSAREPLSNLKLQIHQKLLSS